MPQVVLKNTRRQMFTATMYHHVVCRRRQKCCCSITRGMSPNGKSVSVKQPQGFHVFALKESAPLDMEVLYLPQVKAAMKSGWLVRMDAPAAAAKKAVSAPVEAPVEAPAESGKGKKGGK